MRETYIYIHTHVKGLFVPNFSSDFTLLYVKNKNQQQHFLTSYIETSFINIYCRIVMKKCTSLTILNPSCTFLVEKMYIMYDVYKLFPVH